MPVKIYSIGTDTDADAGIDGTLVKLLWILLLYTFPVHFLYNYKIMLYE